MARSSPATKVVTPGWYELTLTPGMQAVVLKVEGDRVIGHLLVEGDSTQFNLSQHMFRETLDDAEPIQFNVVFHG